MILKKTGRALAALLLIPTINFAFTKNRTSIIRRSAIQETSITSAPREKSAIKFESLKQKCCCKNQCKEDISFGIADIKYDTNKLKILEFGEGTLSMFKGFDSLYGQGAMWSKIWEFCYQKCQNLCVVDFDLDAPLKRASIGYHTLAKYRAITSDSIDTLLRFPAFKHNTQLQEQQLVIIRHYKATSPEFQEFVQHYPSTMICNTAISNFVNNKKRTDSLFTGDLRQYRPYSTLVTKQNAHKQALAILAETDAPAFVIKPVSASCGRGVLFALRDQLPTVIKKITSLNKRQPMNFAPNVEFWRFNTDKHFLIESCETSKQVVVDGNPYDATLRLVYGLSHKDGYLESSIIGYYWKLPALPSNARGSFIEKKLSRIVEANTCAAPLAPEDEITITATMLPILNHAYSLMLQQNEKMLAIESDAA